MCVALGRARSPAARGTTGTPASSPPTTATTVSTVGRASTASAGAPATRSATAPAAPEQLLARERDPVDPQGVGGVAVPALKCRQQARAPPRRFPLFTPTHGPALNARPSTAITPFGHARVWLSPCGP